MTALEYDLLVRIRDGRVSADDGFSSEEKTALNLFQHKSRGWVYLTENLIYIITRTGLIALSNHEEALENERRQRAQQEADRAAQQAADRAYADENREKQFKHDWRIAIFNLISGFVLGTIADHFLDIIGNAVRLWLALKHVFQ